jgi:hypothetical protein
MSTTHSEYIYTSSFFAPLSAAPIWWPWSVRQSVRACPHLQLSQAIIVCMPSPTARPVRASQGAALAWVHHSVASAAYQSPSEPRRRPACTSSTATPSYSCTPARSQMARSAAAAAAGCPWSSRPRQKSLQHCSQGCAVCASSHRYAHARTRAQRAVCSVHTA